MEEDYSRVDLPVGFPQTNNAVENHNRHFKFFATKGRRPSLFDAAIKLLEKVSVISQEQTQAPWNEPYRGKDEYYIDTHIAWNDALVYTHT